MQVDSDNRSAESVPGNHFFACFSASVSHTKGQSRRGRFVHASVGQSSLRLVKIRGAKKPSLLTVPSTHPF